MKKIATGIVLSVLVLLLTACAGGQGPASSSSAQGAVESSTEQESSEASNTQAAAEANNEQAAAESSSEQTIAFASSEQGASESKVLLITAGDTTLEATLEDNVATAELVALLQEGSIEVSLHEYGGFEMIGGLPQSLPTADEQMSTSTGDIVLYQGKQISFFYASNSWSYTRLGHIDGYDSAAFLEALGGPYDSTIELSLKV